MGIKGGEGTGISEEGVNLSACFSNVLTEIDVQDNVVTLESVKKNKKKGTLTLLNAGKTKKPVFKKQEEPIRKTPVKRAKTLTETFEDRVGDLPQRSSDYRSYRGDRGN